MTEEASSPRGRCEGCGKVFRVPQAGKVYRCKACGGSVVAEPDEPAVERDLEGAPERQGERRTREPRTKGHRHVGKPRPIAGRGTTLLVLLGLGAAADAVAVYTGFAQRSLLLRVLDGVEVTGEEVDANDLLYGATGWVQAGLFWVTLVAWLVWIHRASSNQRPLGARYVRFSPGWAVGGWFVPILNLWRPYQVTAEIWRHSAVAALERAGEQRPHAPRPGLLGLWWGAWIFNNLLGRFAWRQGSAASELGELLEATHAMLASDAFSIVSAALGFLVIRRITNWQREAGA